MKKKTLLPAILTALIILGLSALIPGKLYARDAQYIPGEVLVKFKDGTLAKDAANLHSTLKTFKKQELPKLRLHRLKLPKDVSVEETVRKYEQNPNVEYAEPNYIVHGMATTPNDTSFNLLWGLNNNNDNDIDGPEAWDKTTGSDNTLIAVIDSGLAYNHPDFATNLWTNTAELNGTALIDDDSNGYVDDFYGWDFIDNDGYPLDLNGHGTHVAGTIAAQGDNGQGTTGVMWNANIMPVRFLGLSGSGSTFDAISAIKYAYDNGARIINNSWGGGGYSQSLKDTIDQYAADALFIFSAGNSGGDNDISPVYPASYSSPNIISVAATDSADALAWFSNYGSANVDLAAPGVSIYSTIPQYSYGAPDTVYPPAGTVEDFEVSTGDLPLQGWNRGGTNSTWAVTGGTGVTGSNSLEDSPGGNYARNTFAWAGYMTPIDSSAKGRRYLLTFDWRGNLEPDWDWLDIIYSDDGSNWDWTDYRTGTQAAFTSYSADYTSVSETFDSFYFGFRIDSDSFSDERDGVYIDNIKMTAQDIFITSYSYTYYNGTSMAAPHVTGVAGLLLAYDPTLTNMQIKDIILNSVDTVAGLSGIVLTGGRLNAYAALVNLAPPPPPDAPSDLSAAAVSTSRINLSWTDNASNETGFSIQRKTGATGTYSQIASTGANATSYANTGLTASTTYYYRVRAYNAGGNSTYSNEADDTTFTAQPAAPSGLSTTAVSSSQVNLSWTDNASNETGFSIQRKTGATGTYSQIASTGANATSYANTGLTASTTYYYRVRAYNTGGNSAYSNEADATTPADITTSASSGGGGGSSGGCFIATAAYGSYLAPEVEVLKQFRDKHLLTNPAGRKFVELYYRHSPPIADIIRDNKGLRTATRIMLTPVVMLVAYPNTSLFILFSLFMGLFSSLNFNRKQ